MTDIYSNTSSCAGPVSTLETVMLETTLNSLQTVRV